MTDKYQYGEWRKVKNALWTHPLCRFDHLLLSRTEQEIQKWIDIIVKTLEKDAQDALSNEHVFKLKDKEIEEAYNLGMLWQFEELADE